MHHAPLLLYPVERWHIQMIEIVKLHVVHKTQPLPLVPEIHIQQPLVSAVEGLALLGHGDEVGEGREGGLEDHDAAVEAVGESEFGGRGKGDVEREEFVRGAERERVCVQVDDRAVLRLGPVGELGEGGGQVRTGHEGEVGWVRVANGVYGVGVVEGL